MTDLEHLSPDRLAAYLAQAVPAEERQVIQEHLVACRDCRMDLAEASREAGTRRFPRWMAVAAPAAAAAVALFLLVPGPSVDSGQSVVRGTGGEGVPQFTAVSPSGGAPVAVDSVVFVWQREEAGAHYALTVTDREGDVVWTATTADTSLTPPRSIALRPGERYYWFVDALLEGGRSSTSGIQEFAIRP